MLQWWNIPILLSLQHYLAMAPADQRKDPDSPPVSGKDLMKDRYAKAEERNERIRLQIRPLLDGERPKLTYVAAAWMAIVGAAIIYKAFATDLSELFRDSKIEGDPNQLSTASQSQLILLGAMALVAAFATLRLKSWGLMGTQMFLGLTVGYGSLWLLAHDPFWDWPWTPLVALNVVVASVLFWKMIRLIARVQKTDYLARGRG